jgi:hypothetical protein
MTAAYVGQPFITLLCAIRERDGTEIALREAEAAVTALVSIVANERGVEHARALLELVHQATLSPVS